jgi:hypothetical protein
VSSRFPSAGSMRRRHRLRRLRQRPVRMPSGLFTVRATERRTHGRDAVASCLKSHPGRGSRVAAGGSKGGQGTHPLHAWRAEKPCARSMRSTLKTAWGTAWGKGRDDGSFSTQLERAQHGGCAWACWESCPAPSSSRGAGPRSRIAWSPGSEATGGVFELPPAARALSPQGTDQRTREWSTGQIKRRSARSSRASRLTEACCSAAPRTRTQPRGRIRGEVCNRFFIGNSASTVYETRTNFKV